MKTTLLILLAILLSGCGRSPELSRADNRILCSMNGEAFFVQPTVGNTSFLQRVPESDRICPKLEAK